MSSSFESLPTIREHAQVLLETIGVSRIIIVDDEYSDNFSEIDELLGICSAIKPEEAAGISHLNDIDFDAVKEVWAEHVLDKWEKLGSDERQLALTQAREIEKEQEVPEPTEKPEEPQASNTDKDTGIVSTSIDVKASVLLEEVFADYEGCAFATLSLEEWYEQSDAILADELAETTVFLFDRDFQRERAGTQNEGLNLVRGTLKRQVGYCGLISHTIPLDAEYEAWNQLAAEHSLIRDRFVVIAKERLTSETPDIYGFLRMLRLVALSGRCADVKAAAWRVFEASVSEVKLAMERLSVLDFDQIVFSSSRSEGVWEPDTLFRVFGVFMRREARVRLHDDEGIKALVTKTRRVSAIPEEVTSALSEEYMSSEALNILRHETYELENTLNKYCLPIDVGDIFEKLSTGKRYILLAQPCGLMVRSDGKRSYEDKQLGRTGALVELVTDRSNQELKERWVEVPFYDPTTGYPVFADLGKVHQVRLAVLDLCAFDEDGLATIDTNGDCPDLVIDTWRRRFEHLKKLFACKIHHYDELSRKQIKSELTKLAVPTLSETLRVSATVDKKVLKYDFKRVMRLLQPRSGALLTQFTQYQARAAFEHPMGYRTPQESVAIPLDE